MKSISVLLMSFTLIALSNQVLAAEPPTITSDCSDQLCVINTTTPASVSLSLYNKAASVMTIDFSYEVINFDVSYDLTNNA